MFHSIHGPKINRRLDEVFGNKTRLIKKIIFEKLVASKIDCSLNELIPVELENGGIYIKPAALPKRSSPYHYKDTVSELNPDYYCILVSYHVLRNCTNMDGNDNSLKKHYSLLSKYLGAHSNRLDF